MDSKTHEQLIRDTNRLRHLLSEQETKSVVGFCLGYHLHRANDPEYSAGLSSPARQIAFLLGLLLSTAEPSPPKKMKTADWEKAIELLEQIFLAYQAVMWPQPDEIPNLTTEWKEVREVAGQALLHYHNTGLMATIEQLRTRVRDYITPFDDILKEEWGLSATQALEICDYVLEAWERHRDRMADASMRERQTRLSLIDEWEKHELTIDEVRKKAKELGYEQDFLSLFSLVDKSGSVAKEMLVERFGDAGRGYWKLFSITRGSVELTYLTENNPVDTRPLICIEEDTAMCPSANALFQGVLLLGERTLEDTSEARKYRRARDRVLEHQVEDVARVLFGQGATYYPRAFETHDGHYEHDLIVVCGGHAVVIEAKASPPKEPFRDLERGFVRLRHAFRGDTGIQKAYEQGERIRARCRAGEVIHLFDEHGQAMGVLDSDAITDVHMLCVTRDDWGPLAVDLSLLLERPSVDAPYPWAVDILNFQAIAGAWEYLGLAPEAFLRFLGERRDLHGRTICWDELDLVGFWLKHDGFHWITESGADKVHINPHYADLFEEIYAATHLGGPPVELEVAEPFMGDVRAMLAEMFTQLENTGRNEPCPCGSGKKFKRCHGKGRR